MWRPAIPSPWIAALGVTLATTSVSGRNGDRRVTQRVHLVQAMSDVERRRADQLICLFENDTLTPQYAYIERLDDGRGYTAGRVGFTSGTGDLYLVVQRYAARAPRAPLAAFLARLHALSTAADKDDTAGLEGLPAAWASASNDPRFRAVQDALVDELYSRPAMAHADRLRIRTALGKAMLYDTIVQHGGGDDPDSLAALLGRTQERVGGTPREGVDEACWLREFLAVRREDLSHADDSASREEWAASVGRVDVFRGLLDAGNLGLRGPVRVEVGGREVRLP